MYGSWVWEGWLGGRVGVLAGILSIAWAAFSSFPALQTGVTRWDKVGGEIISISSLSGLRTASVQLTHSIAQHVGKDAGLSSWAQMALRGRLYYLLTEWMKTIHCCLARYTLARKH